MSKDKADTLAKYYRELAKNGQGVGKNTTFVARRLGMSESDVRAARHDLIKSGRLKSVGWVHGNPREVSIDGIAFKPQDETAVTLVMSRLRRRFSPVYDPRVVANPAEVPTGKPTEIVIGGQKVGVAHAVALAMLIEAPGSNLILGAA